MLPRQPPFERDEPDMSPALARRRDQMLGAEPRLVASQTDPVEDWEADPEIPPIPPETRSSAVRSAAAQPPRIRLRYLAAGAAAIVAVGVGAWIALDRGPDAPASGEVPYVTAEAGPEKIRPENEGGLDVPNQDIRIYNELSGDAAPVQPEVLLPPPENPVAPPAPALTPTESAEAEPPAAADAGDIPVVAAPELTMEPSAGSDAAAPAAEEPAAAGETAPTQTAAAGGAFRIQLAAVKSSDAAKVAWKKLTKTHPDVLGGLKLNLVKVERADGALYRIQGGMFVNRAAAESACGQLKQKNQDCLVVAP